MSKSKFSSKTANKAMINYASKELGIDLSHLADDRAELIIQLNSAEPGVYDAGDTTNGGGSGTEPLGGGSGTEPKGDNATLLGGGSGTEPKKVMVAATIRISSSDSQFKENFVQVGVNGVMHQVMKDVEVKVSAGVVDVLTNAIESNFETITDPATRMQILKETKTKRWPFEIIERHYA